MKGCCDIIRYKTTLRTNGAAMNKYIGQQFAALRYEKIIKKQNVLKGIKLFTKIPFKYLSGICKIGIPTAIQGMVYCGISMVLTRMVSGFGAEAVAVQRGGGQIESVSWNTADGFGTALNAFFGQK